MNESKGVGNAPVAVAPETMEPSPVKQAGAGLGPNSMITRTAGLPVGAFQKNGRSYRGKPNEDPVEIFN